MSKIVYQFSSPTCRPCQQIKPAIEMIKEEYADQVEWIYVNTHDDEENLAAKFQVRVVPTIVFVKDGQEIGRHSGTDLNVYLLLLRKLIN